MFNKPLQRPAVVVATLGGAATIVLAASAITQAFLLPILGIASAIFLGLVWLGLFCLTILAAFRGLWQMIFPVGADGSGSLGLGALLLAVPLNPTKLAKE